jgi:hypothetical protein
MFQSSRQMKTSLPADLLTFKLNVSLRRKKRFKILFPPSYSQCTNFHPFQTRRLKQVAEIRAEIAHYRKVMAFEEEDALFLVDSSSASALSSPSSKNGHLSLQAIERLQRLKTELIDEKKERERQLISLQQRLNSLWHHLATPKTEREIFSDSISNMNSSPLSRSNIAGIRFEVARLEEQKKLGISTKLQEVRTELKKNWELLSVPNEERNLVLVPNNTNCSSSGTNDMPLLDADKDAEQKDKEYEEAERGYEKCLSLLKSFEPRLILRKTIEEIFLEREKLLEEQNALDQAYDPSRLLSKKPGLSALLLKFVFLPSLSQSSFLCVPVNFNTVLHFSGNRSNVVRSKVNCQELKQISLTT